MKANDQITGVKQPFFGGADHLTLLLILVVTILRTAALSISPLELGVDEAQYWLWSKTLDFGYFTKPPLIAWIIGASHWLFGHTHYDIYNKIDGVEYICNPRGRQDDFNRLEYDLKILII